MISLLGIQQSRFDGKVFIMVVLACVCILRSHCVKIPSSRHHGNLGINSEKFALLAQQYAVPPLFLDWHPSCAGWRSPLWFQWPSVAELQLVASSRWSMQWHCPSGAIHLRDDFEAQGLSNLAWAAAKLRFHHPELMETLGWQGIGGRVELTFASDVLDMAQIAKIEMNTHSMSRGPSYDPTHRPICSSVQGDRGCAKASEFNAQAISSMAWAFAEAGAVRAELILLACQVEVENHIGGGLNSIAGGTCNFPSLSKVLEWFSC